MVFSSRWRIGRNESTHNFGVASSRGGNRMATIIEPMSFEEEQVMAIPVASSGTLCHAVSGYANFYNKDFANEFGAPLDVSITGDIYPSDEDRKWTTYNVHMVVGPKWNNVRDVSPIVAVAGFSFM